MAVVLFAGVSFAVTVVWAAVADLVTLKIRNELILLLLASYALLVPFSGIGWLAIGWSAAVAAAILVGMFILFGLGWIGGGDAKLVAVVALWLGADQAVAFFLSTALFGGILTIAILEFRSMTLPAVCRRVPWIVRLHAVDTGVPYGVAIAAAALFILPTTPWMRTLF